MNADCKGVLLTAVVTGIAVSVALLASVVCWAEENHALMTDKAAIMALAYLHLYEASGEERFLQAAGGAIGLRHHREKGARTRFRKYRMKELTLP